MFDFEKLHVLLSTVEKYFYLQTGLALAHLVLFLVNYLCILHLLLPILAVLLSAYGSSSTSTVFLLIL